MNRQETVAAMLQPLTNSLNKQEVEVVGAANMLDYPEYSDVAKAKSFLSEVENGSCIQQVFTQNKDGVELTVRIGTENDNPELKDCSVVTVNYRVGNDRRVQGCYRPDKNGLRQGCCGA